MAKTCFLIGPIGDPGTDVRDEADQLRDFIVRPVLEELDYDVVRADAVSEIGRITHQIIERLQTADLVVADLHRSNPNVYYELAIRHATLLPAIQMTTRESRLPFDVKDIRTIYYNVHSLREAHEAKDALREQVQAVSAKSTSGQSLLTSALLPSALEKLAARECDPLLAVMSQQIENMGRALTEIQREQRAAYIYTRPVYATSPNVGGAAELSFSVPMADDSTFLRFAGGSIGSDSPMVRIIRNSEAEKPAKWDAPERNESET